LDNEDLSLKARSLINASNPVSAPDCSKTKHQMMLVLAGHATKYTSIKIPEHKIIENYTKIKSSDCPASVTTGKRVG
jgi:hypothetical protein